MQFKFITQPRPQVVCYTAVFSVVTQRSSVQAREKCRGDEVVYYFENDLSLLSE